MQSRDFYWWMLAISAWAAVSVGVMYALQLHRLYGPFWFTAIGSAFVLATVICIGRGKEGSAMFYAFLAACIAGVATGLGMADHKLIWAGAIVGVSFPAIDLAIEGFIQSLLDRIKRLEEENKELREKR
ncbi:MAG: hypothetical protein WC309_00060 [Candidatus Paceibacterota bacterium]|jgi:hypothetical protein